MKHQWVWAQCKCLAFVVAVAVVNESTTTMDTNMNAFHSNERMSYKLSQANPFLSQWLENGTKQIILEPCFVTCLKWYSLYLISSWCMECYVVGLCSCVKCSALIWPLNKYSAQDFINLSMLRWIRFARIYQPTNGICEICSVFFYFSPILFNFLISKQFSKLLLKNNNQKCEKKMLCPC